MFADMAELVDAPDLGSGFARSEGSIPFIRTLKKSLQLLSWSDFLLRLTQVATFSASDCSRSVPVG
jgi:hypothetical protein